MKWAEMVVDSSYDVRNPTGYHKAINKITTSPQFAHNCPVKTEITVGKLPTRRGRPRVVQGMQCPIVAHRPKECAPHDGQGTHCHDDPSIVGAIVPIVDGDGEEVRKSEPFLGGGLEKRFL